MPFRYTDEQIEFLREGYKEKHFPELTAEFNKKFGCEKRPSEIKSAIKNRGIKSGRNTEFKKGNVSWTSGKAGTGLIKKNSGCFSKGSKPANLRGLGAERICTQNGYILVKVAETNPYTGAPTRFKPKHLVIWEQRHGPVPDGSVVIFKDGNRLNCELDNLEMITRSLLVRLNKVRFWEQDVALRPTIRAVCEIQKAVGEKRARK